MMEGCGKIYGDDRRGGLMDMYEACLGVMKGYSAFEGLGVIKGCGETSCRG